MANVKVVIDAVGTMPDGVLPIKPDPSIDFIYIYYRTDGNLYLFDSRSGHEFDLFNMPITPQFSFCKVNPFP
jgi:hypothetical protein